VVALLRWEQGRHESLPLRYDILVVVCEQMLMSDCGEKLDSVPVRIRRRRHDVGNPEIPVLFGRRL